MEDVDCHKRFQHNTEIEPTDVLEDGLLPSALRFLVLSFEPKMYLKGLDRATLLEFIERSLTFGLWERTPTNGIAEILEEINVQDDIEIARLGFL